MNKSIATLSLVALVAIGLGLYNLHSEPENTYDAAVSQCSCAAGQSYIVTKLEGDNQPKHGQKWNARMSYQGLKDDSFNYVITQVKIGFISQTVRTNFKDPQVVTAGSSGTNDIVMDFSQASISGKMTMVNQYFNNATGMRACSQWIVDLS